MKITNNYFLHSTIQRMISIKVAVSNKQRQLNLQIVAQHTSSQHGRIHLKVNLAQKFY